MADTLIIVSDSGAVYQVTLEKGGTIKKLGPKNRTAIAAQNKAAAGARIAEITQATEDRAKGAGEVAAIIMGTFVNLPLLGGAGSAGKSK
ncbi:MAG TPA: hypothetical protein VGS22_04750 [Thermoanaerobaculia bacterium]|jgi:hypothetical protein|nr:hypothetical protein [Thermoanaerobaculia bacterium]